MAGTFRGGVPYVVEVNRLKEAFPVPSLTEGRVIEHEALEDIVSSKKGSGRYYAVVNAWISQMKNAVGVFIVWEPSVGVKILDPAGILDHAETRTKQKISQTGKAIGTFAWVRRERLDAVGQQRLDHQMRIAGVVHDALRSAKRELAVELAPVKSLPKPKLIREAS